MAEELKINPMVDYATKEFEKYERHHAPRFAKAEKIYNAWIGKVPSKSYDWQNQVHVPLMIEAEQTLTPRIYTALFPNDAPVDVRVVGATDPYHGIILKHGLQHYFRVGNVQGHMLPAVSQATLFGTGYAEAGSWLTRRGWQIDSDTGDR